MSEPSPARLRAMGAVRWVLVVLSVALAGFAWWSFHASGGASGVSTSQAKYQCPMHPGIVSPTPGQCPICGMDLVPIAKDRAPTGTGGGGTTGGSPAPYTLEDAGAATVGDGGAARFFCPMHPQIRSHDPGRCPLCKMKLEAIPSAEDDGGAGHVHGAAPVTLSETRLQSIGVRFAVVEEEEAASVLRLTASVAAPEQGTSEVHVRTPAFVERVAVRETGAKVSAGQELVAVYSPEVFQAQVELLAAKTLGGAAFPGADGGDGDRVSTAARTRLELLGMSPRAVDEVLRTGKPTRTVSVVAPAGGFVTRKNVVLGSYVTPETTLYEIVDLSKVYVVADVFAERGADVKVGTKARFSVTGRPELTQDGAVDLVYPRTDPEARTTRVRMPVANAGGAFVPGQPGTLEVQTPARRALFVPRDAVVDTGSERHVFVDHGAGTLVPRAVTTGTSDGERVEITRGLRQGERVVSGATFLVDSESRLRAALGGTTP